MVDIDKKVNPKFISRFSQISESSSSSSDEDKSDLSHEETLLDCNFTYKHH